MSNDSTIQTSNSADLVTVTVLIDGTTVPEVYQLKNISVEKEINRIPFAQLIYFDGEAASQDFQLSNEALFLPGHEIEIKAGYHNDEATIFKGVVIKHSIKIRESATVLVIECRDKAVKTTLGRHSRYYYDSTDSDIIEQLLQEASLEADVTPTAVTHKELVQYQASYWDFMMTRSEVNGAICVVDDGKVTIGPPDVQQEPIETVTFGTTMLDFDAEMDARNQFSEVTAFGWNPSSQEIIEVASEDPGISLNGNVTAQDLASALTPPPYHLKHGGMVTDSELQEWSNAKALFQQLSKTKGIVSFQGIPNVKPNTLLTLEGVGDRFNGTVFVTAVRHEIADGNWKVTAEFGMNPKWFSETYDIQSLPASGLLPAIHGLQIGIVTQLEEDPDGEDRILVQVPIINNEEQGIWARVATLDAGENRGSFFRPEIEDEVIIGFINDDPNDAIVLGMLHSSAKPAPLTASDDNHEKGFVTRSEMRMIFNDEKTSWTLSTPSGKQIIVDEDADLISIADDHQNKITLDANGILLESAADINVKATGDLNLEGTNITVKANAQFKAEGSAGAEVSTSAIAVLKGSLVQIN